MGIPDRHLTCRVPEALFRRLEEIADFHNLTRSYLVVLALRALAQPHGPSHTQFNQLREAVDRRRVGR